MADIIITITHGDPVTQILTMTNGPTTNADQGDQVTWVIAPGSGVAAITGIVEKSVSPTVGELILIPFQSTAV